MTDPGKPASSTGTQVTRAGLSFLGAPPKSDESKIPKLTKIKDFISDHIIADAIRRAWREHVVWTRNLIMAATNGTEDLAVAKTKFYANQVDIGLAIGKYYGSHVGNEITKLMTKHADAAIMRIEGMVKGVTSTTISIGDSKIASELEQVDIEIAKLITRRNSNVDYDKIYMALHKHGELAMEQVRHRLAKLWNLDAEAYSKAMKQIDDISNLMCIPFPWDDQNYASRESKRGEVDRGMKNDGRIL